MYDIGWIDRYDWPHITNQLSILERWTTFHHHQIGQVAINR